MTMQHLDLTLGTPGENLALDEALWEACEAGGSEVLRFWESPVHFVVLGYANRVQSEVNLAACQQRGFPVLRRVTGGGTVLQGPGCLNYTLALGIAEAGATATISATNLHILNRHAAALTQALGRPVRRRGDTDLAIEDRKFSGNSQRRGRRALLFHGTFLLGLDFRMVEAALQAPSRQPDYRLYRDHTQFLMNLGADAAVVKSAIRQAWGGDAAVGLVRGNPPWREASTGVERLEQARLVSRARELAAQKYNTPEWNGRF